MGKPIDPVTVPESREYRTADIYYAAFLRVAKVPYLRTERDDQERRTYFYFENNNGLRELRTQFFNREARVVARDFAEEIRALKTLLHMDQDAG